MDDIIDLNHPLTKAGDYVPETQTSPVFLKKPWPDPESDTTADSPTKLCTPAKTEDFSEEDSPALTMKRKRTYTPHNEATELPLSQLEDTQPQDDGTEEDEEGDHMDDLYVPTRKVTRSMTKENPGLLLLNPQKDTDPGDVPRPYESSSQFVAPDDEEEPALGPWSSDDEEELNELDENDDDDVFLELGGINSDNFGSPIEAQKKRQREETLRRLQRARKNLGKKKPTKPNKVDLTAPQIVPAFATDLRSSRDDSLAVPRTHTVGRLGRDTEPCTNVTPKNPRVDRYLLDSDMYDYQAISHSREDSDSESERRHAKRKYYEISDEEESQRKRRKPELPTHNTRNSPRGDVSQRSIQNYLSRGVQQAKLISSVQTSITTRPEPVSMPTTPAAPKSRYAFMPRFAKPKAPTPVSPTSPTSPKAPTAPIRSGVSIPSIYSASRSPPHNLSNIRPQQPLQQPPQQPQSPQHQQPPQSPQPQHYQHQHQQQQHHQQQQQQQQQQYHPPTVHHNTIELSAYRIAVNIKDKKWMFAVKPTDPVRTLLVKAQEQLPKREVVTSIKNSNGCLIAASDIIQDILDNNTEVDAVIESEDNVPFDVYYRTKAAGSECPKILEALKDITNETVLNLSNAGLTPDHVSSLIWLKDLPRFHSTFPKIWDLSHNTLGCDDCEVLLRLVTEFSSHVTSLNISFNNISRGADKVLEKLSEFVEELDISGNPLENSDALSSLILSPGIQVLHLNACELVQKISAEFEDIIKDLAERPEPRCLRELHVADNELGNSGVQKLLDAIYRLNSSTLVTLDLSNTHMTTIVATGDAQLGDNISELLKKILKEGTLVNLSVAKNEIISAKFLETLLTAEEVDLSETNFFSNEILFQAFCTCAKNNRLETKRLKLSNIQLQPKESRNVLVHEISATSVESLELNSCGLGIDGMIEVLSGMKESFFLLKIGLQGNLTKFPTTFGATRIQNFENILNMYANLEEVDMRGNVLREKPQFYQIEKNWKEGNPNRVLKIE